MNIEGNNLLEVHTAIKQLKNLEELKLNFMGYLSLFLTAFLKL